MAVTVAPRFRQLALTHAAMMGGEAAMVVALADSFFFDVDPAGARGKVLGFLVASFAPFLLIAPWIGPAIDRARRGRRLIVQAVALLRAGLQLAMVAFADEIVLFPLVFAALVLSKTYTISKSALVPTVVRTERELVEANSKLGLIAGLAGAAAVVPAAGLQLTAGTPATLVYGAGVFVAAFLASLRLPREQEREPVHGAGDTDRPPTTGLQLAWVAMLILRAAVGFMLFHLAFVFRTGAGDDRTRLGVALGVSSLAVLTGNAVAPRLRERLHEERLITLALALPAATAVVAVAVAGADAGIAVAAAVNFAAAIGRLSFESIVQRDGPAANRGQTFARFETRFQLGWVIAAVVPVVVEMPATVGYLLVAIVLVSALFNYRAGLRSER